METYDVVGFRKVDFTDQKTGKPVAGYTLFLERTPRPEDHISGVECSKMFISRQYVDYEPCIGDTIRIIYNKYGKVGAVETC